MADQTPSLKANKLLVEVQEKLKVPKDQKNEFGGFNYRSAGDILEKVKPLIAGKATILLDDQVVNIGNFNYVEATAQLITADGSTVYTKAYAREQESRKGMDASQITGATSSYARKYAMAGLFALDDGEDADTMDNTKIEQEREHNTAHPMTVKQKVLINDLWNDIAPDDDIKAWYWKEYNVELSEATTSEASRLIERLKEGNV